MSEVLKNISNKKNRYAVCLLLLCISPSYVKSQEYTDTLVESAVDSVIESVAEETTSVRLSDSIVFRSVPDTTVNRLKTAKEFEYANDPEYWIKKKEEQKESRGIGSFLEWLFGSAAVKTVMYLLLTAILLYTIYRIIVNNNLFYVSAKKRKEIIDEEADGEMQDDILEEKIADAIRNKEYRKAVRYLYLKTLRGMDAKGWIQYHAQATNYEYLNQIGTRSVAPEFGFATQVYEYVWYGGFELSEEQFTKVYMNYQKINNALGI